MHSCASLGLCGLLLATGRRADHLRSCALSCRAREKIGRKLRRPRGVPKRKRGVRIGAQRTQRSTERSSRRRRGERPNRGRREEAASAAVACSSSALRVDAVSLSREREAEREVRPSWPLVVVVARSASRLSSPVFCFCSCPHIFASTFLLVSFFPFRLLHPPRTTWFSTRKSSPDSRPPAEPVR